jgi:hypothetical protein
MRILADFCKALAISYLGRSAAAPRPGAGGMAGHSQMRTLICCAPVISAVSTGAGLLIGRCGLGRPPFNEHGIGRFVRRLLAPENSQVLYDYCLVAVRAVGVTEVPVSVFPSDETVTL